MTLAWADHARQFALLLGKAALEDEDCNAARRVNLQMAWGASAPQA